MRWAVKNHHLERPINESISLLRLSHHHHLLLRVKCRFWVGWFSKIFSPLFYPRCEVDLLVPKRKKWISNDDEEHFPTPSFVTQPAVFHSDLHFSQWIFCTPEKCGYWGWCLSERMCSFLLTWNDENLDMGASTSRILCCGHWSAVKPEFTTGCDN